MDIIFLPLKLFVWHPAAALIVSAAFWLLAFTRAYSRDFRMVLGGVGFVWLAYGGWEAYMTAWRSPTGDMAIRVDMLLVGPVLLVITIIGTMAAVRGYRRSAGATSSTLE